MKRIYVAVICMLAIVGCGQMKGQTVAPIDIQRYAAQMMTMPFERMNMGDVTLTEYALVDLDGDGCQEIWVRGDINYQAFFIVKGDSVEMIAYADGATDLTFHKNAISWSAYYSPGQWSKGACVLRDSRVISSYNADGEFTMEGDEEDTLWENYWIDGKESTSDACEQFQERLGEAVDEPVADWHAIEPVICSADYE